MNKLNPLNAYRETKIKTASQGSLIIMIYDAAINELNNAYKLLAEKDKKLDLVNNSIIRAQDLITELMVSLDFDKGGDVAKNLFSLYMYFNQRLLDGNLKKDAEIVAEVQKHLSELQSAWQEIINKDASSSSGQSGVNIAG